MSKKIYKCCICHRKLEDMPIRLVKQLGDNRETYRAFHNIENYDFCKRCYNTFNNWILKHKEENKNDN